MISYYYSPGSRTNKALNEALDADLEVERIPCFKDTKPRHAHVVLATCSAKRFGGRGSAMRDPEEIEDDSDVDTWEMDVNEL